METSANEPVLERWSQHYHRFDQRCLFLENLDPSIDPQTLSDTFSRFGKIHICEIAKPPTKGTTTSRSGLFGCAKFIEHIRSKGLKLTVVSNDGNCIFRALSIVLYGHENKHLTLRQQVANEMERLGKKAVQPFLSVPMEKYILKLRQSCFWAGALELSLVQTMFNRPIVILDADIVGNQRRVDIGASGGDTYGGASESSDDQNTIYLSYHGQNHYNAVVKDQQPQQPQQITETKHAGLCVFIDASSVDSVIKLSPLYILQRQLVLYRTPENSPVVGDLCCYTTSTSERNTSSSSSMSDSSDRELSESSLSSSSSSPSPSLRAIDTSGSTADRDGGTTPAFDLNNKSPRFRSLKLSFHRKKTKRFTKRTAGGTTEGTGTGTDAATVPDKILMSATGAGGSPISIWKLVATFAVMMVVLLSAYIVYQQNFIRHNRENVADLLHRLNVLQRSIGSTKKQQCGASNNDVDAVDVDVGLVEN
jgi:hypothetical protein